MTAPLGQTIYNAFSDNSDKGAPSRRNILWENICFNLIATVTGGVFLTGLILIILENETETIKNQYLGLVISLQLLANTTQIFTPFILGKSKSFRPFVLICRVTYFVVNVGLMAFVPLLPLPATHNAIILIVLVIISQITSQMVNPALSIWHIDSIPNSKRADWMSIQQLSLPICNAISSLVASFIIDHFQLRGSELTGVIIVRGILLLFVFLEMRTHFKIQEFPHNKPGDTPSFSSIFLTPLKSGPFLITVLMVVLWTMVANLPGQYYNAYLLENLNFTYTHINLCTSTSIPLMMLAIPVWNKLVHKNGWLKTCSLALALYTFPYLVNCLIFKSTAWLYLVNVMYGNLILPGINLCFANLPYLKMPAQNQTSCIAFYNASAGLAAFAASYLGRAFVLATENKVLRFFSVDIVNKQYICLLSFAILLPLSFMILFVAQRDLKKEKMAQAAARAEKTE